MTNDGSARRPNLRLLPKILRVIVRLGNYCRENIGPEGGGGRGRREREGLGGGGGGGGETDVDPNT